MKYLELRKRIKLNLFSIVDVFKFFPEENEGHVRIQIARFTQKDLISRIKRGLYCFEKESVDEFVLAGILYRPSYISLETALLSYGVIPDIPQMITSVTTITTKKLKNSIGTFNYFKIDPKLFFGYKSVQSGKNFEFYHLAQKEKALLDYLYLRKINSLTGLRIDTKSMDINKYNKYKIFYPAWVKNIKLS